MLRYTTYMTSHAGQKKFSFISAVIFLIEILSYLSHAETTLQVAAFFLIAEQLYLSLYTR